MIEVTEEEFQQIMETAISSIPSNFKKKIDNLVFIVEPSPTEHDLSRLNITDSRQLLGLYSGIPYTHRDTWYMATLPDRIILFQKNIEALCNSKEDLISRIREVVIHEVAHYFGMTDKEIREAGY
jgi:predicted Zn-dependent protease with MMP-like domain